MRTIILWYRNDLRVHDHPALQQALHDADRVVPVFILDTTLLAGKRASSNRTRFLLESLQDLRQSLGKAGGQLFVRDGAPAEALRRLAQQTGADAVYCTADYSGYAVRRDAAVVEGLAAHDIALRSFPGRMLLDEAIGVRAKNGNIIKVFTPFWKQWSQLDGRPVLAAPAAVRVPDGLAVGEIPALSVYTTPELLSPDVLPGGETAGRQRLERFLRHDVLRYAQLHNDVGRDGTSRLSSYIHFGCLSPLEIAAQLPEGQGPDAFHRQLAWRDFYYYVLHHFPDNARQEFQERYRTIAWHYDEQLLAAWQEGRTGYPVVDAAMRQLRLEGWMHNRGRLIVGSFLTKDLGLDWRLGERHFMRWLVDGDQANNNGNWQWIASVGVDPAPVFRRLYNPASQQANYDPEGAYVRRYVPELARVDDRYLAEPWKMPPDEQKRAGCVIGKDYPGPIVDHAVARTTALERYRSAGR